MRHAYSTNIHSDNPSTSCPYKGNIAAERWLPLQREKSHSTAAVNNLTTVDEKKSLKRSISRQSLLKRALSMQVSRL